jgi:hypothetical protein
MADVTFGAPRFESVEVCISSVYHLGASVGRQTVRDLFFVEQEVKP